jgi:hypothetical protein
MPRSLSWFIAPSAKVLGLVSADIFGRISAACLKDWLS